MNNTELISENNELLQIPSWGIKREIRRSGFSLNLELSPFNQRIVILDYFFEDASAAAEMLSTVDYIVRKNAFGKVWAKVLEADKECFTNYGFIAEAVINNYFAPGKDAVLCSHFYDQRKISSTLEENQRILKKMQDEIVPVDEVKPDHPDYHIRIADESDLYQMAELYRQVFPTYPYPVYDPAYLRSTMENIHYALLFKSNTLVATAAADINFAYKNAEMTDFATLPAERGKGLASILLSRLEEEMLDLDIHCLYSIARSKSYGMNSVFLKMGYKYSGTLINNCNISGGFEDMNVFCKNP